MFCFLTSLTGTCCQNYTFARVSPDHVYSTSADSDLKESKEEVKIFPNPSTSFFGLSETQLVGQIFIFNILGQNVKKFEVNDSNRYYVGDLIKGSYIVQLRDHKESIISSLRMKKE